LKKLFIIILLTFCNASGVTAIKERLALEGLDLGSKTYLGWARVLSSPSKRQTYSIELNSIELELYLEELKDLAKNTNNRKMR